MLANILQELASPLSKEQVSKIKEAVEDLSIEQVNWLSGYFAGLSASGSAAGLKDIDAVVSSSNTSPSSASSISKTETVTLPTATILYGSQTGNARGVAEQLSNQLQSQQIAARLVDMADFNPKQLKKEQRIFLIVSTHGEGEPPDDAIELHEFVHSKKRPDLSHLEFAVFALGDSSYEFYCQTGKDFDAVFEQAGAKRLFDRVDADVDYREEAESWQQQIVAFSENEKQSAQDSEGESSPQHSSNDHKPHLSVVSSTSSYSKFEPYEAEVVDVVSIVGSESDKPTVHVEIDLGESGLNYLPGDALGVWPTNSSQLVEETLQLLSLTGEEQVVVEKETKSLRDALTHDFELTQVAPSFVKWIAEQVNSDTLKQVADDRVKLQTLLNRSQIPELLRLYPVSISAEELVQQLRRITPRLYSIASSQSEVDEEVHLTVGLVAEHRDGIDRFGSASRFLAELSSGDSVKVFVEKNKHFKLPSSIDTKIIMIGAGTGVAPYRGFIQERASQQAKGESWLIFGNPHFSSDFLYQLEWQQYLKKGQLSRIDLAFSRDQAHKVYVQDKIKEQAKSIYQWILDGAHLYVCGNKDRLGKSVDETLITVIAEQSQQSLEAAAEQLAALKKAGRYQKDVY